MAVQTVLRGMAAREGAASFPGWVGMLAAAECPLSGSLHGQSKGVLHVGLAGRMTAGGLSCLSLAVLHWVNGLLVLCKWFEEGL